ncbi:hypothetical protein AZE42_03240 [Rhizopogon vesiculosus]|uniref:Uncharacterized protein n=1 Tax=Rhizopogon vesiculosus TaxID=180088 RepID=A0A1J8R7E4_9AGAM|nr:hypothetical protein AZE42_03240 [Rhizopogon vesiculosus]
MSQAQRRLSARRGSVTAPDPFGQHASLNHDSNRSSSSTLTIVRVLDSSSQTAVSTGNGTSPINLSDPPAPVLHRRSLRHPGGTNPSSTSVDGSPGRLSFAFSSFAPNSSASSSSPSAPAVTVTPGRRASSPSTSRSRSPSQFNRRLSSSGSSPFSKPNLSPEQLVDLARQSTSPRYVPPSSASTPSTPHLPALPSPGGSTGPVAGAMTAPAAFTPLPADVYLPFIDRPTEVTQLLSTPPTARLFSLLSQTFPRKQGPENPIDPTFSTDPAKWSFGTLRLWLTIVDRPTANDTLWVRNARRCVLSHSELIWERLKGALGVPPDLEVDGDDDVESVVEVDDCPLGVPIAPIRVGASFEDSDTPYASSPPSDEPVSQHDSMPSSPPLAPLSPPTHLSIEPILATLASNASISTTGSVHPPPLSLPSTLSQSTSLGHVDGLQDIGEEAEDEDCADTEGLERETEPVKDSSQIHGLRISTSPMPSSPAITPQSFSYPASPVLHHSNGSGRNSTDLKLPSEVFLPLTRRLSRTSSHGSVSSLGRPTFSSYTPGYQSAGSDFGDDSERMYDPVGDRAPGNPIFPSNFARLAQGPTLSANNPKLRLLRSAPYAKWAPGGRPPSWVDTWDPSKHEYAATIASGSSVGVGSGE